MITRHVKNRGDFYTVENLFGETETRDWQDNKKQDNLDRKSKRKKQVWIERDFLISWRK